MVALASASGIYFAYRQIEINRNMMQIQKSQTALQESQLTLQQTIEHQHREELIAKYMGGLETGKLSEQLGAAYALSQIEGDEPIAALTRGLLSDFDPVGETACAHIANKAGMRVKSAEIEEYLREYQETRKNYKENPSLRPRTPIGFDKAVSVAMDLIAQNPAVEKSSKRAYYEWSLTVPVKKRPSVVERALRLIRILPGRVMTTTGEGYGPKATLEMFLPAQSEWSSCSAIGVRVAGLLINGGYLTAGDDNRSYDIARAEAVRLLHQFRHAEALSQDDQSERSENEPQMVWAMGQLMAAANLRTANFSLYKGAQAFYGYRSLPFSDPKDALATVEERIEDFMWFAGSSEKSRAAAIVSLDELRKAAYAQGLKNWWDDTWQKMRSSEYYENLNGPVENFYLSWDWQSITPTSAQHREITKATVQQAAERLQIVRK